MNDRYIRQIGLFPPGRQKKLGNTSILIVGAGGKPAYVRERNR